MPERVKKVLADACLMASKDPELMKEANALWIYPEHYVGDELVKAIESDFIAKNSPTRFKSAKRI